MTPTLRWAGYRRRMAAKRRWSDLSGNQQKATIAAAIVELALTARVLRDLVRRPGEQVRGPKIVWVLACFVQPVGPIAYLAVGRRIE
jgi:Phospholipase_D-nuclease N-terminal